jgi:hypothetical protein
LQSDEESECIHDGQQDAEEEGKNMVLKNIMYRVIIREGCQGEVAHDDEHNLKKVSAVGDRGYPKRCFAGDLH